MGKLESKETEIRDELIREAITKSKALAETLAICAGQRIVGVKEIVNDRYSRNDDIVAWECNETVLPIEIEPKPFDELSPDKTILTVSIDIVWLIGQ